MRRFWQQIIKDEKGQALPIVLVVLVIGGLMIAPALNLVSTSLNAGKVVEENVEGAYAAEAGVEDVLWQLIKDPPASYPYSYPLPKDVNQMEVAVGTEDKGAYTLYYGELIEAKQHYDWLGVEMVGEEEAGAYKCTITATWSATPGSPSIKLTEIGMKLPAGYEYVEESAGDFGENLSTDEPDIAQDWDGAYMVSWEMGSPRPEVSEASPVQTQTFYISGEGELEGDYACMEAQSSDIGQIGEFAGTFYSITSRAYDSSGAVAAKIVADVLVDATDGKIYTVRWEVTPQ